MSQSFKLIIEYDGSGYHGWQRQAEERTVQGEIEKALATMTGQPVVLHGAGRTDAGVHALGQVAHFRVDTRLTPEVFVRGLNSLLDEDIVIKACQKVAPSFHARYNARDKLYRYRILNQPLPAAIGRQYAWHIRAQLDHDAMRNALTHLVGEHDFKAFEGAGSPRAHTRRRVLHVAWEAEGGGVWKLEIRATGFLRFMVRNITGTLVEVGRGRISPNDLRAILLSCNRHRAGATAPAHGLVLVSVTY